jgi:hypothetical protein
MKSEELVRVWGRRAREAQIGHYRTAVKLERRYRRFGYVVVALNAVVGTSVFASLSKDELPLWVRFVVGLVSIFAAVLAGIQTFEKAGERSETHRVAATQFSSLQRDVELFLSSVSSGPAPEEATKTFLAEFNGRYVQLVKESPTVDEAIHVNVKKSVVGEVHPILGAPSKSGLESDPSALSPS